MKHQVLEPGSGKLQRRLPVLPVIFIAALMLLRIPQPNAEAAAVFVFEALDEPVISATFSGDFAELTAHRRVAGAEANAVSLVGSQGLELNLSKLLFGETEALVDSALIDQGLFETGVVSVPLDSSFFPGLVRGRVGIQATFTDTSDALFAIDFLSLTIETGSGITRAFYPSEGANDGFGIGLFDGETLPDSLPRLMPAGATGTGFDEAISSKSLFGIPEPGTAIFLVIGLSILLHRRR